MLIFGDALLIRETCRSWGEITNLGATIVAGNSRVLILELITFTKD